MKSGAAQYLREVNKQLSCPNSIKKPFLCQLEEELSFFCTEYTDADIEMLSKQFGPPEEVAEEFLSELGEQAAERYTRTRKRLIYLTFGVILIAVIFAVILRIRTNMLQQTLPEGEFVASIVYETEAEKEKFSFPARDTIFGSAENTNTVAEE